MNDTSASDRLKKVMRIALVGIKPSDQVLLKGYLRILLRLEANLEWVSANNQQIDLIMVNYDFRNSESVQKLINNKPNTATIYITRGDSENGYFTNGLLVLPLKDLEPLTSWLFSQVPFLSVLSNSDTAPAPANANAAAQVDDLTDPIAVTSSANQTASKSFDHFYKSSADSNLVTASSLLSHTNSNISITLNDITQSMVAPTTTHAHQPSTENYEYLLAFAKIFGQIQQRTNEVLTIKSVAGTVFAHINPKQQRVWKLTDYVPSDQPWILTLAGESVKNSLDVNAANDMVQWLWSLAIQHIQKLEALLDPQITYHIDSWVKPLHDADQHDHLKIQCVLEVRSVTIDELVALSQCSLSQVKKTLIGLFVTGAFSTSVYQQTISNLSNKLDTARLQAAPIFEQGLVTGDVSSFDVKQSVAAVLDTPSSSMPAVVSDTQPTAASPQSTFDNTPSLQTRMAGTSTPDTVSNSPTTWNDQQTPSITRGVPVSEYTSQQHTLSSSQPQDSGSNGMMGFLSRLRRRLGL